MLAALCQEPWCFTPTQVGQLTDWQVVHLYLKPAEERAKRFEEERAKAGGGGPPPGSTRRSTEAECDSGWTVPKIIANVPAYKNSYFLRMTGFGIPYQRVSQMWESQFAEFVRMYPEDEGKG
jgi:hypothetical protein